MTDGLSRQRISDKRQTAVLTSHQPKGGIDGESDDLAGAVEGEILVGEIGRLPRPEDDDAIGLCHDLKSGRFS